MRRLSAVAALLLAVAIAWLVWPRRQTAPDSSLPPAAAPAVRPSGAPTATATAADPAALERDFPIAAPLNRPDSTLARDLDVMSRLFDAWRSNFPRTGNPVGENAEITAALLGDNPLGLALLPRNHPAINARGEICDRWGTPFRLHQLSGERMEIHSAGPDRRFGTDDDARWTPPE
jgi:hypothetical protein